ncbi:MAG: DMT family transporter [Inhella sp.]|jgi:drug/metabolite transporter (DMT)-like permease|uniref:DMT family transporter n=1 Tax=Inhella sp. TaxID=1921806 RepID=UPI0022C35653|nr:DMT family transporter [Inhella sp.]MCZ8234206.1 DMT family transporter [Inhella sp.]
MSHRRALALMVLVTLLWSTAGVVTRHLESVRSFELTFWRSAFTAASLVLWWGVRQGLSGLAPLGSPSSRLWLSALCWAVMFTAFMLALTLTTVANVLVVMALGPLMTALLAWMVLRRPLPVVTVVAVLLAGGGVAWMFGGQGVDLGWGPLVALAVPLAASVNWTLMQAHAGRPIGAEREVSLPHAVALGAALSAAFTLPAAWPLQASGHDIAWLAFLGVTQLAIPCVLLVHLTRVLSATEVALVALLELVFGVAWVWWLAGEVPGPNTLSGASLVVVALVFNELKRPRRTSHAA